GFYYLKVETRDEPNEYELYIETECIVDDEFAGNHQEGDAEILEFDQDYKNLKLCAGQSSWFGLLDEDEGEKVWVGEVHLEYGVSAALDVIIYDEAGEILEEGSTINDKQVDFYFEPESDGLYFLEIRPRQPMLYEIKLMKY